MFNCLQANADRRRHFWTTQLGCDYYTLCGSECATPGLKFVDENNRPTPPVIDGVAQDVQIDDSNPVRSLAYNILMTDGRKSRDNCNARIGTRGGHWSDFFREDNNTAGMLIDEISTALAVSQVASIYAEYVRRSLQKMITLGVALSVDVTGEYLGLNRIRVSAIITGVNNANTNIHFGLEKLNNQWIWRNETW